MKIKTKLMLALSMATIVPVLIVCITMSLLSTEQARSDFKHSSSQTLSAVEHNFVGFVDSIKDTVKYLANHQLVTSPEATSYTTYYEADGKSPRSVVERRGSYEYEVFKLLQGLGESHDDFAYVYSADLDGGYVEWPGTYAYSNWDPKSRPWYRMGMQNNGQVALGSAYYYQPDDDVYVSAVSSFKRDGQTAGVVTVDFSIKTLMRMASETVIGQQGSLMVVEGSGAILVDVINPENSFQQLSQLSGEAYQTLANTQSGVINVALNGQDYHANVYTSQDLGWKFVALVPETEIYASANRIAQTTVIISALLLALFLLVSFFLAKRLVTPIEAVSAVSQDLQVIAKGEGDLTTKIMVDSNDETGLLSKWFNHFLESIRILIGNIKQSAVTIAGAAEQTSAKAQRVAEATSKQLTSIEQIVAAGQQMVEASNDAAQNCADSAQFSEQALAKTLHGKTLIKQSSEGVNRLGERLSDSRKVIIELENETSDINQILSTIQEIAEQTNLLALNAAIEAARAGDQGRGFAVVADEVRGLAKRTQESTEQINKILSLLLQRTKTASHTMNESFTESEKAIALSEEALEAFETVETMVGQMKDMTLRTAASAEQQRTATGDINDNINRISESAQELSHISDEVAELCHQTDDLSQQIYGMVAGFRT
ncbi:Methyl-accepting chemotaxis protein PctB [Marinomonas aquimarina]|uniref:Methyl-accepting chemotaxis protein PctB n=1 Tax=Marinomonas aquimarina TaxID=295068 RepID=A0A1A8TLG8_9GAMM|nr:methyl-accepting chemotaxis protein [Marinomonas aquimarina]SBS33613.1 Methyl-accepting chemotaxis protein PctB [Marinomonas aquimarina]